MKQEQMAERIKQAMEQYDESQRCPRRRRRWGKKADRQAMKFKLLNGGKFITESRLEREV